MASKYELYRSSGEETNGQGQRGGVAGAPAAALPELLHGLDGVKTGFTLRASVRDLAPLQNALEGRTKA